MFKNRKIELKLVKDDTAPVTPTFPTITEKENAILRDFAKRVVITTGIVIVSCVALNVLGEVAVRIINDVPTTE